MLTLPHPGDILKPYLEAQQRRRDKYSLRALARDVGLSPGMVSLIFSKRRAPSQKSIDAFAKVLKMRRSDVLILKKAAILHAPGGRGHGSAHRILTDYIEQDASVLAFRKYRKSDPTALTTLTKWYHYAVLELCGCELLQKDDRAISRTLGTSLSETREAISTLVLAGLIEKKDGAWKKKTAHLEFPEELSQAATRQYHRTMITRALATMAEQQEPAQIKRRRIIGATIAVNPENLETAIDSLNRFLLQMTQALGAGACKEIYQLNFQLVPLTKREEPS